MPSTYVRSIYGASVNAYLAHFASILMLANEELVEGEEDLFEVVCDGGPILVSSDPPAIDIRALEEGKTVDAPAPPATPGAPTTRLDPWTLTVRAPYLGVGSFEIVLHADERIETALYLPAGPLLEKELLLERAVRPSLDDIEVLHELVSEIASGGLEICRGQTPRAFVVELLMSIFAPRPEVPSTLPAPPNEEEG